MSVDAGTLGRQEIYRYEKGTRLPRDWLGPIALALGTTAEALRGEPRIGDNHLTGIWTSRYTYLSTTRGSTDRFHHVLVQEYGTEVRVDSIEGSNDSPITMRLERAGSVMTGTWTEQTSADGHYRGATYHGAVQLVIDPTCRSARGLWVGCDRTYTVESGPWELAFRTPDTGVRSLAEFARSADPAASDRVE